MILAIPRSYAQERRLMSGVYSMSSKNYLSPEEEFCIQSQYAEEILEAKERAIASSSASILLDNSLITPTNRKKYTHKVIKCGSYYQVYDFNGSKVKIDQDFERMADKEILFYPEIESSHDSVEKIKYKKILAKNINRTKNQFDRIVMANEDEFKTFVTLTFKDNISDIAKANKIFQTWKDQVKRYCRNKLIDFKYVCVPEYQERGAVHYHLLTNLELGSDIIFPQKEFTDKQMKKMSEEQRSKCYDVKYWKYGFSSVFDVRNLNVVGYMSKYMTKDIDNRLFGHRRYFYSMNLNRPSIVYLDIENEKEGSYMNFVELFSDIEYQSVYIDKIGNLIDYTMYKLKGVMI